MSQSTDNSKQKVSVHLLLALTGLGFSSKATWHTNGAHHTPWPRCAITSY